VFLHTTVPGLVNSTLGNLEALWNNASLDIFIPGAIVPPKYSALFVIAQNVVAVPKSTTITGVPYFSTHATAFTILSAPTCLGLSYFIFNPVFIPGPTTLGCFLQYFIQKFSRECITLGTTDDIITSSIHRISIFSYWNKLLIKIPYSSDVFSLSVFILQYFISSLPSYSPKTILVFPTSNTKSIYY